MQHASIADAASELPQSSLLTPRSWPRQAGRQLPKGVAVAGEGREKPGQRRGVVLVQRAMHAHTCCL